jgi:twinkle protein
MEIITPDDIDFSKYFVEQEPKQKVKPAHEYIDDILFQLKNPSKTKKVYLPWDKTRDKFQFRDSEVTVWTGINGHGKSLVTGQVAMSLIAQGEKVCIASFEMKPTKSLQRMLRQYCETNPYSEAYQGAEGMDTLEYLHKEFADWTKGRMWFYDQQGTISPEQVVAVGRYCAKELGVTHYFVDSLMKCVHGEDDYNGQKEFVNALTALARDTGMHIHLVHHSKKLSDEEKMPGKFDAKGSGSISDQVDNFITVWRNKAKENDMKIKGETSNRRTEPDAYLACSKQRNGDDEPLIGLWYEKDSTQFVSEQGARPLYMPLYPHVRA